MKKVLLVLMLLMGVSMHSQFKDNYYSDIRASFDPSVLLNEGNLNLKIEASTHFNMSDHWRVFAVVETLTGHDGYYGMEIGSGFSVPYKIWKFKFKIEPGIGVGLIVRPNMPTLMTLDENGNRVGTNEGFVGFSHSLNIRHKMYFGEESRLAFYIHQRLILRSDLHFAQELTVTPNDLPFYNYDNAIGISYEF